jgi:hypothetical protein
MKPSAPNVFIKTKQKEGHIHLMPWDLMAKALTKEANTPEEKLLRTLDSIEIFQKYRNGEYCEICKRRRKKK